MKAAEEGLGLRPSGPKKPLTEAEREAVVADLKAREAALAAAACGGGGDQQMTEEEMEAAMASSRAGQALQDAATASPSRAAGNPQMEPDDIPVLR
jgi:hypothetical protein